MKKLLVTLLAASMCLSMLAGCSSDNEDSKTNSGTTDSTASNETSEPQGNVEMQDFTVLGDDASTRFDYATEMDDMYAFKAFRELMEAKGINLVMEYVKDDQYLTTLQTRFAAQNNIPMYASMYQMTETDVLKFATQGVLLDINELLEKGDGTAKDYWYNDTYGKQGRNKAMTPEGNFWWLPNLYISLWENGEYTGTGTNLTSAIRKDWLDQYNLEIPTTLEEYKTALKTFNEQDPSGSGAGVAGMNVYSYDPCNWGDSIANWFGLVRGLISVNWDTDTAVSPWHQDTVKDYLTFANSLYADGLYDPEMIGSTSTLSQKIANNQVAGLTTYALTTTYEPTIEAAFNDGKEGGALYADIYPIEAVKGVSPLLPLEDPTYIWDEFVFTTKADPELAAKFLDVYYSPEHIEILNYGVEGIHYEVVNGEKQWKKYVAKEDGKEFEANQLNQYLDDKAEQRLSYGKIAYTRTVFSDVNFYDLWGAKNGCVELGWATQKAEYQDATIDFGHYTSIDVTGVLATASAEEQEKYNDVINDMKSASQQAISAFIMGQRSLDELDSVVAELDTLGLADCEAIYQARHDRFLGK